MSVRKEGEKKGSGRQERPSAEILFYSTSIIGTRPRIIIIRIGINLIIIIIY